MARFGSTVLPRTRHSCTLNRCCTPAAPGSGGGAAATTPHTKAAIAASAFSITSSARLDIGRGVSGWYPQRKAGPSTRRGRRIIQVPIALLGLLPDQFVFTGTLQLWPFRVYG